METQKTLLLVGENDSPNDMINRFSVDNEVVPWVKYYNADKEKLKEIKLLTYDRILKEAPEYNKNLQHVINAIKNMSSDEYFNYISSGCYFDEYGNAITTENPNGYLDSFESMDLLKNKSCEMVNELKFSEWDRSLKYDLKKDIEKIWDGRGSLYSDFCKHFKTINELFNIYRPKFNSIIYNSEWFEFDIDCVEGSIKFNDFIKKIDENTVIRSYLYNISI